MQAAPIERPGLGRLALVIAIAIGIAVPLVIGGIVLSRRVTTASRLSAQAHALVADLTFGRAQAMKQGAPVVTCASSDGATKPSISRSAM